ncbi:MAG: YceI family protein [Thiolinea sp.]
MKTKATHRFLSTMILLTVGATAGLAQAEWTLDNERSKLYFASTKKDTVSEVHRFETLSGQINDDGKADLEIDLASVNTKIEIRDERMQQHLFETDQYRAASVTLDLGEAGIEPGEREITATLNLHGVSKEITAQVMVMRQDDQLQVLSLAPVMLNAADFGMDAKLKPCATSPSCPPST